MTAADLRTEILSGPLRDELAPLVERGSDADIAIALNRANRPGYIPRRHVAVTFARYPVVYGLGQWVERFGTMPAAFGGGSADFGLYALFLAMLLVLDNDTNLQATVADLTAGFTQVPTQLVSQEFRDALLAGEVKISRAVELWGQAVSSDQVATALRGK